MRTIGALLVGAGLLLVAPQPAVADATSTNLAVTWLTGHVDSEGFIESDFNPGQPDLGTTAQAVIALAAAGQGAHQVDGMEDYLAAHVDLYAVVGGSDAPGALGLLILGAVATGRDPSSFGGTDLVARLLATEQANGLFGAQDPTFDGAYRQGVALLALGAVGTTVPDASQWLIDQQCDDGGWAAYRADTSAPCPPADPVNFTGPDTNSTALAALGLAAQNVSPAHDPVAWFEDFRLADGGWPFIATHDGTTDAASTGLSMAALRVLTGEVDADGAAALAALQVGCDGTADAGGIAFQADPGGLVPSAVATSQALFGLTGVAMPLVDAAITPEVNNPCETVTTGSTAPQPPPPQPASPSTVPAAIETDATLARTGPVLDSGEAEAWSVVGATLAIAGAALVLLARSRQRRA